MTNKEKIIAAVGVGIVAVIAYKMYSKKKGYANLTARPTVSPQNNSTTHSWFYCLWFPENCQPKRDPAFGGASR